jgi:asparaginyl-tRNA synthetase
MSLKTNNYTTAELLTGKVAVGSSVAVRGWVRTRRDSKAGCSFIALNDGAGFKSLQVVVPSTVNNYENEILKLTAGCAIIAIGKLVTSIGEGQAYELQADKVEVVGWVYEPDGYPIAQKYHTPEYLREHAHLRVRTNLISAVTRVQHRLAIAIHNYFDTNGFYWIRTPIITASDCEGAGQMFRVSTLDLLQLPKTPDGKIDFGQDFFGCETFLTVSGQLNIESYCEALSKVYTFGPAFRAENSNTSRHLAELWMLEPEIAFADLNDNADLAVAMLKSLARTVLEKCSDDMQFFADRIDKDCINRLEKMVVSEFVKMDYTEAVKILEKTKKKFTYPVQWGLDLQSEHERYLAEEHVGGPLVLMNYPKAIKSFYMRVNADNKTVAAMDVLVPGVGEIIGGSQREERYEVLLKRMQELNMDTAIYQWYLDLRRYGSVPHAGFGMGFERLLMYVTGLGNIRDVIPFPRTQKHAEY